MANATLNSIEGLNLRQSLLGHSQLIRAVNVTTGQIGAKEKRPGYGTYLGTPDTDTVNTLFSWHRNNGTQFWNYRASGSSLYYSTQGTGAWTICGNGTINEGAHVGHAVLNDVMIIGDGVGSTRHSSDGTSFTNTTLAPIAGYFEEYQGRIWAFGTASNLFYSTVGTASDWTTDSSSILIPNAGKGNGLFKSGDRLFATKNSGLMFRWDGYSLVDIASKQGYSSPYSVGEIEGYRIGITRNGFYGNGGGNPEYLSGAVEKQIFNNSGSAIAGTSFDSAPGVVHRFDYLCAIGTTTDDLTYETVNDCIMKYDVPLNEWVNWRFANYPTAFHSFKDENRNEQLIFGDANGQCYMLDGTALTDNGNAIDTFMEGFIHGGTNRQKKWNWIIGVFNPVSRAKVQIALSDNLEHRRLKWMDLGDSVNGVVEYHFPPGSRARYCFWKVYESSMDTRFALNGWEYDADIIDH
jgi:hypothetical protein